MAKGKRFAVIDIGSNSVRMVVYDDGATAIPLYNEKASCALGKNLGKTGLLNPKGAEQAAALLTRFAHLSRAMEVNKTVAVATAAVRTAKNGSAFIRRVKRDAKLRIRVIPGKEEARLSAEGVRAAFPDATGIMGDMGGGSMELVAMKRGAISKAVSLPLGPLALADKVNGNRAALKKLIAANLQNAKWIGKAGKGNTFYAVGGVFRAIARLHMDYAKYPLHVVHAYEVSAAKFVPFLRLCQSGRMAQRAEKMGIAKNRIAALPYAAEVLLQLFNRAKFSKICFSTYGLREGVAAREFKQKKNADLLMNTCKILAQRGGRFGAIGDEVYEFLQPLLQGADKTTRHYFRAAAWISDIGWADHPEERAKQIFHRILHAPLLSVDHAGRCFIALCCYARYNGDLEKAGDLVALLPKRVQLLAVKLGASLRFADTLCGGAPHILPRLRLQQSGDKLTLKMPKNFAVAGGEEVPKRFKAFAELIGLNSAIKRG